MTAGTEAGPGWDGLSFPTTERRVGTIENGVLLGLEETLFLAGGMHSVIEFVTGARAVSDASVTNFHKNIQERFDWASERNVGYLHVIFPDKQSIVPERWPLGQPVKLGEIFANRLSTHFPLLYVIDRLAQQAEQVVSRTDTHVTDHGSILAAGQIVEQLVGASQHAMVSDLLATITGEEDRAGDLGSKLTPPMTATHKFSTARLPGRWLHNDLPGGNNGLIDLRFCGHPIYDRRLVVFGDSFARDLARFFQYWFREVIFFRTGFFDPDLAALCRPDFLITENVERYLDDCRVDAERPNFFMYPHFKGAAYAPSAEFANAFSAILSAPRQPYVDFLRAEFGADPTGHLSLPEQMRRRIEFGVWPFAMPDATASDVMTIEPVRILPRHAPEFIDSQSDVLEEVSWPPEQDIHGSYLCRRNDVLLFGPSLQVSRKGRWSCESRAFAEQFIEMVAGDAYQKTFPGPKPDIAADSTGYSLNLHKLSEQVDYLDDPLFLATPLEPNNWGRWVSTVIPKVRDFKQYGAGRRLLCYTGLRWQRSLLTYLGVREDEIVNHDPGRTYFCRDLMSVEYSVTNMTVSQRERDLFAVMRTDAQRRQQSGTVRAAFGERIFVSRLSFSSKYPAYRVLQNERELIGCLRSLGFDIIEPETLSFDEQILAFGNAKLVVGLGGAGIYNSVFCAPGTTFVTLESSGFFLRPHCALLGSLGLRYGVIVGVQDPADPTPVHKRWKIDVDAACRRIIGFAERSTHTNMSRETFS